MGFPTFLREALKPFGSHCHYNGKAVNHCLVNRRLFNNNNIYYMEHDLFFEPSIIIERKIQRELSHTCCRIGEERLASEISYPRSQEHDSLSLPHFLSASTGPLYLVKSRGHSMLRTFFAFLSSSLENCQLPQCFYDPLCVNRENRGLPIPSASCLSFPQRRHT